jgi:hypothetical protein
MITNIVGTIIVTVITNTYQPTQYDCSYWGASYPPAYVERWCDEPVSKFGGGGWWNGMEIADISRTKTRKNPDVKITEVIEIRTLRNEVDGIIITNELSRTVLSKQTFTRKVETKEEWVEDVDSVSESRTPVAVHNITNVTSIVDAVTNNHYTVYITNTISVSKTNVFYGNMSNQEKLDMYIESMEDISGASHITTPVKVEYIIDALKIISDILKESRESSKTNSAEIFWIENGQTNKINTLKW